MFLKLLSNMVGILSPNIAIYRLVGTELKSKSLAQVFSCEFCEICKARFPLGDKWRYLAIISRRYLTINLKTPVIRFTISNLNFKVLLTSCLTLKEKWFATSGFI